MKLKTLLLGAGIGLAGLIGVTSTSYVVNATEHVVITRQVVRERLLSSS